MKITIAIPSYNKEKYIRECLESILHEKEHVEKILLVDNQSPDKTFTIAKEYEPEIVCIRNETNLGMSGNWNRCIDLCDTEWLMIFHADDILLPDTIQKYLDIVKKYPDIGMIYANAHSIIEDDTSTITEHPNPKKEYWSAGLDAMTCKTSVCSAVMVRKDAYRELGYFIDKSLSSDIEMWHRVASKYSIGFISDATVIYRNSKTSTGIDSLINRSIKAIQHDWDTLEKHMASHYPTEESRMQFLEESRAGMPSGYFAVAKANLRAGKYLKVLHALWVIVVTYGGSKELLRMVYAILKKRIPTSL